MLGRGGRAMWWKGRFGGWLFGAGEAENSSIWNVKVAVFNGDSKGVRGEGWGKDGK